MAGYPVSGVGKPQGGGAFPLWEDVDFLGGVQVRANTTDRDSIPLLNQKVGMLCFVLADLKLYYITATGTPATWAALSFGASAPAGTGFVKVASNVFSVVSSIVAADVSDFATAVTARIAATAPTGTGFTHYVSGVRDAAAKLIDLAADVSGNLPAASVSGLTTAINSAIAAYTSLTASQVSDFATAVTARIAATAPTGNGFARYVSGVRNSAAQLVDLVNDINAGTVLPAANGGGQVLFPSVTTSSSTPQLLASSPVIPNPGGADVFASVLFRDASANLFLQVIQGIYNNATGTVAGVYTPVAGAGNGTLLNCAVSLVINNTTKRIELYGTNTGGTSVTMTAEFTAKVG